ncbi:MAG: 30S ribosomal protein S4 [Candidatus Levybacteria bacterium RIFCSPHIGHO2_02_FULL_39_36]|nr:MAG: 30S ribosomal protein S4 [Candidatus Levybacteria bacterium GW2011_GWA1_39_11]KKR24995.1 MAG: 30S ribosomal protein S4 [Candidatus Levybacteria bacterium GW2011_GWB1_39_7]KKR27552.1 MAG: 30S ribosomal protein S4 [Microgenomates group bacterium GW2011_GWC1_39_7]KKR48400.1 MAG: 30S ribosomal protein S4 [Candidatus Levybacteria bacterium GW2011_GWA2_40_16]OGH15482.1 MAG: 30S ribosomal protein S4 [Candidatus Levybacteria bacterium RIFCSPHIGHO2_01_FULL_38_96]OGH25610.1 MAG: 30S ribosomal pr
MARYTGPKHKLARREGINILGKTSQSLDRRLNVVPGSHAKRRTRKLSEFGVQLREKQKLKRIYGLLERQFRKYVKEAQRKKINTEDALIQLLETRLDNVVYRFGLGKSRAHARQLVSHRHILVNGKKINIPSYAVRRGDLISIEPKLQGGELKARLQEIKEIPVFLEKKDLGGKLLNLPTKEDVSNPVNYQLVIEFYSR